jgi:hypothetical protein
MRGRSPAKAPGAPAVRACRIMLGCVFCNTGIHTTGCGRSVMVRCLMSLAMPTTVIQFSLPACGCPNTNRAPIGLPLGQYTLAMVSDTIATRGRPAVSSIVKSRPATSAIFIVRA